MSPPQRPGSSRLSLLGSAVGPLLGLVLVVGLFWSVDALQARRTGKRATFGTAATAQKILRDSSQVGVAALGMTIIIIAGGIDLSAGAAMSLAATVVAWFFREQFPSPESATWAALAAGIGTGILCGAVNGTLISLLRVVPFIITLGTMTIYLGIGLILSNDTPIRAFRMVPDWIINLTAPYPVPPVRYLSSGVWAMLALAVLVSVMLHLTVFGRHVFALGSNESTARLCGVPVTRVRILVYALAGLFVGVAGVFQFAMLSGEGDPKSGMGKELEIIAAVVIGGGSLNGGRGSVLGTLAGACIMAVILDGCVRLNVPTAYQKVILGHIIIVAVAVDQVRQRRLSR